MAEAEYKCWWCEEMGDGNVHHNPEHDEDHVFILEQPKERNDGVMDMTYPEVARAPLFDDRDDDWDDEESGTGEPYWVNL